MLVSKQMIIAHTVDRPKCVVETEGTLLEPERNTGARCTRKRQITGTPEFGVTKQ